MKILTVTLIALTTAVSPAAFADPQEISVDINYDGALLADAEGAKSVMESIEAQAKAACTTRSAFTYSKTVDEDCVEIVITNAVNAIVADRQAEGLDTAEEFASLATVELASL